MQYKNIIITRTYKNIKIKAPLYCLDQVCFFNFFTGVLCKLMRLWETHLLVRVMGGLTLDIVLQCLAGNLVLCGRLVAEIFSKIKTKYNQKLLCGK